MKKKFKEGGSTSTTPLSAPELFPRRFTDPEPFSTKKGGSVGKKKGKK